MSIKGLYVLTVHLSGLMEIIVGTFKAIVMYRGMVIGIDQGQTRLIGLVTGSKRQKANHGRKEVGRKTIIEKTTIVGINRNT